MNILTFDIEDWFHINFEKEFNNEKQWLNYESRIEKNTETILEILDEKGIKATFFCLGWVARKYPSLIRAIIEKGHDIGSHSDIHNLVSLLNKNEFYEDLTKSINSIEDITGSKIKIFRAPAFSIGKDNLWAFEILNKNGIEIDCSVFPSYHDFGGFPGINAKAPFILEYNGIQIKEFPMSTYNFFGKRMVLTGGGYFRFFPYKIIRNAMKNSKYNMTYFHPRDLDAEQPILENLGYIREFKSYFGIKHSLKKFEKLINEFNFISISKATEMIDWDRSSKMNVL